MGTDIEVWPEMAKEMDRPDLKYLRERFGIVARGGARLNTHGAWKDYITVQLDREWKEVPGEFWKMLELTVPHLSKAIEIGRTFNILRLRYQAVLAALDKVGVGMCVATDKGSIAVCNEEARRILTSGDGLSLSREEHIVSNSHDLTARLRDAIQLTSQTAIGEGVDDEIALTCPRLSRGTPFLIVVSPLRDSDAELEPGFSGSLIYIIDPDQTAEFSIDGMSRIFGLSAAETLVCEALIHGGTVKIIADQRGVSPETVRSQVRSIYSKTGVTSRTGLIRLALLVNPPIR
jgi:DNA-binding CsgD family transcriptional regulator/PAS domain-containing protein